MSERTIADLLQEQYETFTRAERQLVNTMLENYPVSGLGTITAVAKSAYVSTPTVARLVQKLGFKGYPQFQACLHRELEATISGPIEKHNNNWAENAPNEHILNRFTDAVSKNIRQTLSQIDVADFQQCCELLADESKAMYVVGGRITRAMADYFFLHMQVVRPDVTHIQSVANAWPHYLLNIKENDVVVIFDIRRYENSTLQLAQMVAEKGAKIILFTDQWRSPIHKLATITFSSRISVPSAWDSSVATMLLVETIIAEVVEKNWQAAESRMEALEYMFDQTRIFRKFV